MALAKFITAQEKEDMLKYHKQGYSAREIAEILGRSYNSVRRVLIIANPASAPNKTEPTIIKEKMTYREMIKELYDAGYRIEDNELVCYQRQVVKLGDIVNNG